MRRCKVGKRLNNGCFFSRPSFLAPRTFLKIGIFIGLFLSAVVQAEPWIDTRDEHLRSDIELLADIGIIKIPVTTYPLMWAGIIKDLDEVKMSQIEDDYKELFWRVKKAGKAALSSHASKQLTVTAAKNEQQLRSFGDESRGRFELAARSARVTKRFAWNIEVTQVDNPKDNKQTRYDGSYAAVIAGNWIITSGWVERWWGPGWDSNNLLSNNARPPLGISLQRNYSDQSAFPVINWIGPWTFNTFVAELSKDKQAEKDAKVAGASFAFKPHQSLEIGLRATALWGAKEQADTLESLLDTLVAYESCNQFSDGSTSECDSRVNINGDRIAGLDFRWTLPVNYPVNIYGSHYGEDETQLFPDKAITQLGMSSIVQMFNSNWRWYIEHSNTTLDGNEFNQAYESEIYQTGYRYLQRSIGSTFDNDSDALSFGVLGWLNRYNQFAVKLQHIKLNQDGDNFSVLGLHTLSESEQEFNRLQLQWIHKTSKTGEFEFALETVDDEFDDIENGMRVSWKYQL